MATKSKKIRRTLAAGVAAVVAASSVAMQSGLVNAAPGLGTGGSYVNYDPVTANQGVRNVMYYGDWSVYGGQGNFMPEQINNSLITHMNYAFIYQDKDGNLLLTDPTAAFTLPLDLIGGDANPFKAGHYSMGPWHGWSGNTLGGKSPGAHNVHLGTTSGGVIPSFQWLRTKYPNMRFGVSVGGWSKSAHFSTICRDDAKRRYYVQNLIEFMALCDMDFIDIDWEYPGSRRGADDGGKPQGDLVDNTNDEGTPYAIKDDGRMFIGLLNEIKAAQNELSKLTGRVYELSAAVPATPIGFMKGARAFLPDGVDLFYDGAGGGVVSAIDSSVNPNDRPGTEEEYTEAAEKYIHGVFNACDFVNIMTYDMRGAWDGFSGHQSPVYSYPESKIDEMTASITDEEERTKTRQSLKSVNFSSDQVVSFLLGKKDDTVGNKLLFHTKTPVDSKKIVYGVCIYTRGWHDVKSDSFDNGAPATPGLFQKAKKVLPNGAGEVLTGGAYNSAPITEGDGGWPSGVFGYGKIEAGTGTTDSAGTQYKAAKDYYPDLELYWDDIAKASYLYGKNSGAFLTFDDEKAVHAKAEYIDKHTLGGMISWMASNDKKTETGFRDGVTLSINKELWGNTPLANFSRHNSSGNQDLIDAGYATYPYLGEVDVQASGSKITIKNITDPYKANPARGLDQTITVDNHFPLAPNAPYMEVSGLAWARNLNYSFENCTFYITFKSGGPSGISAWECKPPNGSKGGKSGNTLWFEPVLWGTGNYNYGYSVFGPSSGKWGGAGENVGEVVIATNGTVSLDNIEKIEVVERIYSGNKNGGNSKVGGEDGPKYQIYPRVDFKLPEVPLNTLPGGVVITQAPPTSERPTVSEEITSASVSSVDTNASTEESTEDNTTPQVTDTQPTTPTETSPTTSTEPTTVTTTTTANNSDSKEGDISGAVIKLEGCEELPGLSGNDYVLRISKNNLGAKTPKAIVTLNGKDMVEGVDFSVTYANNNPSDKKSKATITPIASGKMSGSAVEKEFIIFVKGDVDSNGNCELADFAAIKKIMLSLPGFEQAKYPSYRIDISADGSFKLDDVTLIKKHLLGMEKELPPV